MEHVYLYGGLHRRIYSDPLPPSFTTNNSNALLCSSRRFGKDGSTTIPQIPSTQLLGTWTLRV